MRRVGWGLPQVGAEVFVDEAVGPVEVVVEGRHRERNGPAQGLVEQVAIGQRVLGDSRAGGMHRRGGCEEVHQCFPVVEGDPARLVWERREPRLVGQQVRRVVAFFPDTP